MNTVAHLFDQFSTTSVRRDDETPVIQAFGTVARHLRGPLASLLVFMEVADLYRRSKASANPELRHVLFGMLRRAKATGDPLGYRAGVIDLGRLVDNAVALSMPSAQNHGIRIEVGSSVSVILSGDERLLLEAMDAVIDLALRYASPQRTMRVGIEPHSGSASVKLVVPVKSSDLLELEASPTVQGDGCNWRLWLARLILMRHGGSLKLGRRRDNGEAILCLELPDHVR
jgi:signal transduction histidine kinase